MGVSLQVFLWDFFPHIYDTFWRLHVLSGVVRLTCTRTCRVQDYCECVWKCVCPTSASLRVSAASFIPPDIHASFLWAQEQLATPVGHSHNGEKKHNLPVWIHTHTHREGERETHTHTLLACANMFPVVLLCSSSIRI